MGTMLRRLRGTLGIAATWSLAFAGLFVGAFVLTRVFDPDSIDQGEGLARVAAIGAALGLAAGAAFATLLAVADRQKTIAELSVGRSALWGALGTATLPLFTAMNGSFVLIVCPIAAGLAAVSVAVAKRAALRARIDPLLRP
ncbi:MAG: hypothetical protein H7099_09150 [Gemmatimonadaceae bacterium]|nr:hypothetical protein [Gemmatimonadaceae bacterium]